MVVVYWLKDFSDMHICDPREEPADHVYVSYADHKAALAEAQGRAYDYQGKAINCAAQRDRYEAERDALAKRVEELEQMVSNCEALSNRVQGLKDTLLVAEEVARLYSANLLREGYDDTDLGLQVREAMTMIQAELAEYNPT